MLPVSPENILLILLSLCVFIQFFYGFYYFLSLANYKKHLAIEPPTHPVSVIVCAHNEYENLRNLLPKLLKQHYQTFEIVIVDDRSEDDSGTYLQQITQFYRNVKLVSLKSTPKGLNPKKYALTIGIKVASHEHLLFTDADCVPVSENWITEMQKGYRNGEDVVIGYGRYQKPENFLAKLIQFETLLSAFQYLSFAIKGKPYMGVGRNLSYTKTCFYRNKGFASHIRSLGGDDDLFVRDAAANSKIGVIIGAEAQTESLPEKTFGNWWRQKRRHLSAGQKYKGADRFKIGTFILSNVFFYVLSIILLILHTNLAGLGIIFGLRCFVLYTIYYLAAGNLKERLSVILLPILDLAYYTFYVFLAVSVFMFKKVKWT